MKKNNGNSNFKSASITVSLIILLLFGAVIFFIGWTQIRVKSNQAGVVVSKIKGISEKPVESGTFSWHWDFLLPTNAELKIFDSHPYSYSKTVKGILPSGEVYQAAYSGQPDFSYNFDFEITVSIEPEDIVQLMKKDMVSDQTSLEKYLDNSCEEIARSAANSFLKKAEKDMFFRPETVVTEDILYMTSANKRYPNIEFQNFTVKSAKFPDFKLYENVRERYIDQLSKPNVISGSENKTVPEKTEENFVPEQINNQPDANEEKVEDELNESETNQLLGKIKHYIW